MIQNSVTVILCMHMFRTFEPPFCFQVLSPLVFFVLNNAKYIVFQSQKTTFQCIKGTKFLLKEANVKKIRHERLLKRGKDLSLDVAIDIGRPY